MGNIDNRSICIQTNTPTTSILQLEARPLSLSNGCLSSGAVREGLLRKSSLGSNVESPVRSQPPTSRCDNSSSSVERPTMVPVLLSLPLDFLHLILSSTCPILSQQLMPPPSNLRKYNWLHSPPQGILSNKRVFRTSFRTFHCILATQVHQIL